MPLTAAELKAIRKLYDRFDKDNNGCISSDEFGDFIKAALAFPLESYVGDEELPAELATVEVDQDEIQWLCNGMDVNNDKIISFNEVVKCFAAIKEQDFLRLSMMAFRGIDTSRKRKISMEMLPQKVGIYGAKVERAKFIEKAQDVIGRTTGNITFCQWHRILTGVKLPPDFDPYEAKIPLGMCESMCLLV